MTILVTGGAGFIGQHVIRALELAGSDVLQCDRRAKCPLAKNIFLADTMRRDHMLEAVSKADGVIHLAGLLGTQEMVDDPYPAVRTNIIGGLNVLEAVRTHEVPAAFISVGNHKMNNTYAITKSAVERFADMYNKEHGTRVNVVRAMNAYGPGQTPPSPYGDSRVRKIAPTFICKALRNEPLEIYGDGMQVSDMVYVTDLADALIKALALASSGELVPAIEVGPVEHNTVLDVAELIIGITGSEGGIVHLPRRPGENPNIPVYADIESMEAVGIDPEDFVPLEEGMEAAVEYYRRHYGPQHLNPAD